MQEFGGSMNIQKLVLMILAIVLLISCARKSAEAPTMSKEQAYFKSMSNGMEALTKGDFIKAEAAFNKQQELCPKDPTPTYNLACTFARKGEKIKALDALERSVALGWDDWDHIGKDTDLTSLHAEPRFIKAVESAKTRAEAFDKEWNRILRADRQTGRPFNTVNDLNKYYKMAENTMKRETFGLSAFEQRERQYLLANEKMGSLKKLDWKSDPQAFAEVLRLYREFGKKADQEEHEKLYEEFIAKYKEGDLAAEVRYDHAAALANNEGTRTAGLRDLEGVATTFPKSSRGGRAMMTLAQELYKNGDLDKAYPYAKTVLEKFSSDREFGWETGKLRYILFAKEGLPEVGASDWDGKPVKLQEYKGKVLMLDFWATWCKPCVAEIPNVKAAYDKFHAKGLEIVSVSLDHDMKLKKLKKFCAEHGMVWRHIYENKSWGQTIANKYHIGLIPTMILVDRTGKVHDGLRGEDLLTQIETLVRN